MHRIAPYYYIGEKMYCYDFRIAGLLLRVESQFLLNDLFELTNFKTKYCPSASPDAVYTLQLLPEDWTIRGSKIVEDQHSAVYQWQGEEHRYYFWSIFSDERYVLLRHQQDDFRNFCIYLQHEYLKRILPQFRLAAFFSLEQILLQHSGFMLHSSAIDYHGRGILFTAPSGTGKSTQADLWQRLEGAKIINGDRAIIRYQADQFWAYGSPYAGTSGVFTNLSVPIHAIVVLSQAKENTLCQLAPAMAFQKLFRESTAFSWDSNFIDILSGLLLELIDKIPVYHLACLPDAEAVAVLKNELFP